MCPPRNMGSEFVYLEALDPGYKKANENPQRWTDFCTSKDDYCVEYALKPNNVPHNGRRDFTTPICRTKALWRNKVERIGTELSN